MAFDAKEYPVGNILNNAVFNIPRNQRRYVWKEDNWKDLYEDVTFSISEDKSHFIGCIVLENQGKYDGVDYYNIIDGQQRLITITLFLVSIMKIFFEENLDDDFKGTYKYLYATNDSNKKIHILDSEYHTSLSAFTDGISSLDNREMSIDVFINSYTLSPKKDKIIGDAIKFFYYAIKQDMKKIDDKHQFLTSLRKAVLNMTVVRIVSSEEDSYTIFEILNARGVELAPSELLKNYIMRYIQPADLRDEARSKWENIENTLGTAMNKFIKHYATHRFGDTKNKYGSPYLAIRKATRGQQMTSLLNDIVLKSTYYDKIINPKSGEDGNCTDFEVDIYSFFKQNRFEQFRPIFLGLIHQRELGLISNKKYEDTIRFIYNFFICYTIIGEEKSNQLEDAVFKYAPLIEDSYTDDILNEFIQNLRRKIPEKERFVSSFKDIGWSNHYDFYKDSKHKRRAQIVIEIIEKYVSKREEIGNYTIEHILPDSNSINNAQIGNLVPLESQLNREAGDKDIAEKFSIYRKSSFTSTRGIEKNYGDKEFRPEGRTDYLANLMYEEILGFG